jgi:hypothetical protein
MMGISTNVEPPDVINKRRKTLAPHASAGGKEVLNNFLLSSFYIL